MINCVKSCSEVQEDEEGGKASVSCHEDVICDPDQCGFGTVSRAETRLKLFIEIIGVEVGEKLCSDSFLQYFGEEGEIGDGPVIGISLLVKGRFLEERCDDGGFQSRWDVAGFEGVVNDVCD